MIHVVATIDVLNGKRADFIKEFKKVAPKVKKENGCLQYDMVIDLPTKIGVQIPLRDNVVTVIEKWSDLEALTVHLEGPVIKELLQNTKGLLGGLKLQILEPA